jgi:hypothetical protein
MVVRARDLRSNIAELGFEKGTVQTLELLFAEHVELRQHLRELTGLVAQCIDQTNNFVQIAGGMRDAIDRIKRERQQGDEHGEQS